MEAATAAGSASAAVNARMHQSETGDARDGGEEEEEPRLRVQKRLVEPEEEGEMCSSVAWGCVRTAPS